MKQAILNRWVRALTGGRYKKVCNALREEDCDTGKQMHCGLGVLCDLHAREFGNEWEGENYLGSEGVLPEKVMIWAGLPDKDPALKIEDEEHVTFTEFNDEHDYSFRRLATALKNAQKKGLLGKVIPIRKKKPKKSTKKVKRLVKAGYTGISGELTEEQPDQVAAIV